MDDIIKIVFTTLIPCVLTYLFSELKNYRKAQADIKRHGGEEYKSMKLGIQALLRQEMLAEYHVHKQLGYASPDDKDSYEAMHMAYAGLGSNGVMDSVYSEFMALPTEAEHADN